jgi:hypothetical protein
MDTWISDSERTAAQSRHQAEETTVDTVLGTTLLFIVVTLCLTLLLAL